MKASENMASECKLLKASKLKQIEASESWQVKSNEWELSGEIDQVKASKW